MVNTAISSSSHSQHGGSDSQSHMGVERAHRACEKCTRTKKKCDKALPACSRCTRFAIRNFTFAQNANREPSRLTTTCCYDFVYTAPATAVVDPAYLLNAKAGEYANSTTAATNHIFDPNFDISSATVMALLKSRSINWHDSTERYFETMNPWLSIVHPELFIHKVKDTGPDDNPRNPQLALLVVCMQLVTQYGDSGNPTMPEMIKLPAYLAAKRMLSIFRGLSLPSVELIQCTVLLGLYEFGHGDVLRAYLTIGDAHTMVSTMSIRPGKYVESEKDNEVGFEDEEQRCLYWCIFVLDRYASLLLLLLLLLFPTDAHI